MIRRWFISLSILFCIISCNTDRSEITGVWISIKGYMPSLIINEKTIIISRGTVREYKYTLRKNEIVLTDSIGKWYGMEGIKYLPDDFSNIKFHSKEKYFIKKITKDTLYLSISFVENEFIDLTLVRGKLLNNKRFNKIQLYSANGWDYGYLAEIDSLGNLFVKDCNFRSNIKHFGKMKIESDLFERIQLYSNYIISSNKQLNKSSCRDCNMYYLSFCRNDTIKSYVADEMSKYSFMSLVVVPINSLTKRMNLEKTDTIGRIDKFSRFSGFDTIIITDKHRR